MTAGALATTATRLPSSAPLQAAVVLLLMRAGYLGPTFSLEQYQRPYEATAYPTLTL